jgi:aerobic C4-dicarboxylate transport protein
VLLVAILFGIALGRLGEVGHRVIDGVDLVGRALFGMVELIMRLAPIGAFGAIAFTVGTFGFGTLAGLGKLMLCFYLTSVVFIVAVLGLIARWAGMSLFRYLRFIRDEIFVVLATSSSESVLPRMMRKMETAGCSPPVVGLVVPMGYSFNLDGTSIYLTMATLFLAQALGIHLPLKEELGLMGVLLLTSKGAAAVTGGGFITLAATLSTRGHIPVVGLVLLLGVDRFMSEARAITNLIGNGIATVAISKWEGDLDRERLDAALAGRLTVDVPATPALEDARPPAGAAS